MDSAFYIQRGVDRHSRLQYYNVCKAVQIVCDIIG